MKRDPSAVAQDIQRLITAYEKTWRSDDTEREARAAWHLHKAVKEHVLPLLRELPPAG